MGSNNYLSNTLTLVSLNGTPGPNALNAQQFFSTALAPRSDNVTLGGTYLNGQAMFTDNGPYDPASTTKTEVANYNNLYDWGQAGGTGALGSGGRIIYSPINPNLVYRVSNANPRSTNPNSPDYATQFNPVNGGLFQRSTDGGLTFTTSDAGIVNPTVINSVTPLIADPSPVVGTAESRLYLGTNAVNLSQNGGQNWAQYGKDLPYVTGVATDGAPDFRPRPRITAIGTSLQVPGLIVVAVDRREVPGTPPMLFGPAIYAYNTSTPVDPRIPLGDWFDISPNVASSLLTPTMGAPTTPLPNTLRGHVLEIEMDPTDANIITVITDSTGAGRVLRTTDFGGNWLDITGDLPAASGDQTGLSLFSIAIDSNELGTQLAPIFTDDNLYLGTSAGVYKLTDPTSKTPTWARLAGTGGSSAATGTNLVAGAIPDVQVRDVEINTTTGVLSAATFGRGIWQLQIRPFVRGRIFNDVNGNGARDTTTLPATTDTPIAGATALAFRNPNPPDATPPQQFANTTTIATGEYVFRSLPDNKGGYTFTTANASTNLIDTGTKYFVTSTPATILNVNAATVVNGLDIFVFQRVTISGLVYSDLNGNGTQDAGEGAAAGYPVVLFAPAGTLSATAPTPLATVTSDANGNYSFAGVGPLRPSNTVASTPFAAGYQVSVSKAGTQVTQQPVSTGPLASAVNLTDAANPAQTRVGVFQLGQISGTVFDDTNGDGVLLGEPGLGSVTVVLSDATTGAPLLTTSTDPSGAYRFGDLVTSLGAGRYNLSIVAPAGTVTTVAPAAFTITSGANVGGNNFGLFSAASVTGVVFDDTNGNGAQDAGETGTVAGAQLALIDSATGATVATALSGAGGQYAFPNLFPAEIPGNTVPYLVRVAGPVGFAQTSGDPSVILASGQTVPGQNLGVFRGVTISGFAFEDSNGNGALDAGEPALAGGSVLLTDIATGALATVTADGNGNFTFTNVGPASGGYRVALPGPTVIQTTPAVPTLFVTSGGTVGNLNLGGFRSAQFSGRVFNDLDGNGKLDAGEAGLAGQTVRLINSATGGVVGTAVTDANGAYLFDVGPGTYSVRQVLPAGSIQTTPNPAPAQARSGVAVPGQNFGDFQRVTVSGRAYNDFDGNGTQDAGEAGLAGVAVRLINSATGAIAFSQTTDASGNYSFTGVGPGTYAVRQVLPAGSIQTTPDPVAAPARSGVAVPGQNFGDFRLVAISGRAFSDLDGNGTQDAGEAGLAGVAVRLVNAAGGVAGTAVTDANGLYSFSAGPGTYTVRQAVPAGSVQTTADPAPVPARSGVAAPGLDFGDFRFVSVSGRAFNDLDGNGRQDAGEPGLAGVAVQLVNASGGVTASQLTDAAGAYNFLGVGPGTYSARQVLPAGLVQTTPDPAPTRSGVPAPGLDFGDFRLITVSGRVYNDLDGNGAAGAGEPGRAGQAVQLINSATGAVTASQLTDAAGAYSFLGVGAGAYRLQAVNAGLIPSTPLSQAFTATSGQNAAFDFGLFAQGSVGGVVFEDVNRDGVRNGTDAGAPGFTVQLLSSAGAVVRSAVTGADGAYNFAALNPGNYTVQVLPRDGTQLLANASQPVALVSGQAATPAPTAVLTLAGGPGSRSASGTVFLDLNRNSRRDSPDRGFTAGTVGLFDAAGAQLSTQQTDAGGAYRFGNLAPGSYTVRLLAPPGGFQAAVGVPATRAFALVADPTSAGNTVTGLDFGVAGRKRYAVAADGGGGPRVQVYDALTGQILQDFFAYEQSFTGGVRVAEGDVNGDGVDDLVVVAGVGGGPRVRVFDGATQAVIQDYFAYEESFRDGLYVTAADVNGDGYADIITGTSPGGGPRVTVASGKTGAIIADYFAYDQAFRGGVRVGAGDTNGDGVSEVITAPGVGGGPLVITWSVTGPNPAATASFNAFDPGYTGGLYVAGSSGGVTGRSDIVVGTGAYQPNGPVLAPTVRVFDGSTQNLKGETEAFPPTPLNPPYASEARVSTFDRNGDGVPDITVTSGPASRPRLRVLDGTNLSQIGDEAQPFEAGFLGGVFLG